MESGQHILMACFCTELIFSVILYKVLLVVYDGSMGINVLLWSAIIIVALSYLANIYYGLRVFKNTPGLLFQFVFIFNLIFPVLIYVLYQSKISSAV
jgi:hypothetical protein